MDPVIRERWFDLSLPEQMVNIGNEVKRAVRFDEDNQKKRAFIKKALEYIELTMDDPKNKTVIPEIKIGKEILEDYMEIQGGRIKRILNAIYDQRENN